MEVEFNDVVYKENNNIIFDKLTLNINCKKGIGLYGNKYNDFINLIKNKNIDSGIINDSNHYLDKVLVIDDYNEFITNNVIDEFCLYFDYNSDLELEIMNIFKIFDLNYNFLNSSISILSTTEKKMIKFIISVFSDYKTIFFKDLFDGLDFNNKKNFVYLMKQIKKKYNKLIFIHDNDIDTVSYFIDKLLIIDDKLCIIDSDLKVFNNDEIVNIDIKIPNFIKLKQLLLTKGIKIKSRNINELIKEVSEYVS